MNFFFFFGLFLFSDIFSGLWQAFPAFSDPLSVCVCAHTGVRGGRRRKLSDKGAIGEQEMAFGTGCSAEVGMFMVLMLCEVSEKHSAHKEGGGFPSQAAGLVSVPKVCSFQAW